MVCDLYWGSHGCNLPDGHEGDIHQCGGEDWVGGVCSEYRESDGFIRWAYDGAPEEWVYYGTGFRFLRLPGIPGETLVSTRIEEC